MDVEPFEGKLLGLFELDDEGKVLYCSLESPEGSMKREAAYEGSNFFTNVASFSNVDDFQRRFELFRVGDSRSNSFQLNCKYADCSQLVRVVMARLTAESIPTSYLVHFRRT